MAKPLADKFIDILEKKGIIEGNYIPNTSLRLAPDGSLAGGSSGYKPTYSGGTNTQPTVTTPTVPQTTVSKPTVSAETAGQMATLRGLQTPSPANTPLSVLSAGSDPNQSEYEKYGMMYKQEADQVVDPDKIYRDKLKQYQAQIDAVNQIYTQRLNQERLEAQGRMGSTAAMGGRSGVLGSDFGASQLSSTTNYNADIRSATMAEQAAKIGVIMGEVRKDAADEFTAKALAKKEGAESYMNFLKGASERRSTQAQKLAQMLLDQDLDPTQVDWDETLKGSNLNKEEILSVYQMAKKENDAAQAEAYRKQLVEDRKYTLDKEKNEAEIKKIDADIARGKLVTIGEGTMLRNTETGEVFKNPKTYAPTAASGIRVGAGTLTQEQVSDVHTTLQENRGKDNYTSTAIYMKEFDGFVRSGGDPKDFVKEYDPDIYINPNDSTRSFLQSQMKKPASDNLFLGPLGGIDISSAIAEASAGQ